MNVSCKACHDARVTGTMTFCAFIFSDLSFGDGFDVVPEEIWGEKEREPILVPPLFLDVAFGRVTIVGR